MRRRVARLVREVEGRGLQHGAHECGARGYGRVDEDDGGVGVELVPDGREGRVAEVGAGVAREEADAVGV